MLSLFLATALFLHPGAPADGLKSQQLPADVDFVLHVDLEALKTTEMWRLVREHVSTDMEEGMDDLQEFKQRFGLDPLQDIKGVTLYKVKSEEDPTVALFSTSFEVDQALLELAKEPGYALIEREGIPLHTWQHSDDGEAETVCVYVHPGAGIERTIVAASNEASALRAARVLRGEAPHHEGTAAALKLEPGPGSFLYIAASELPHMKEFPPASQVFGLAQGIQVDLGEAGGFLRAHLAVVTELPEKAMQISQMVQGLIAMGGLMAGDQAEPVSELLRGLRINNLGNEVLIDFQFGVQRLVELMSSLDEDDGESVIQVEEEVR